MSQRAPDITEKRSKEKLIAVMLPKTSYSILTVAI
jgi:hypothetical protein